jgi:ABC-type Fe3+/spermidine/putrescine transport system ATPase subunit
MNFIPGTVMGVDDGGIEIDVSGQKVSVARSQLGGRREFARGQAVRIAARPESIALAPASDDAIRVEVETSIFLGSHRTLVARTADGTQLQVQLPSARRDASVEPRGIAFLRLEPGALRVFGAEG